MSTAVAPREEVVSVWNGELDIHVKVGGSGPPLLFLHAAGGPRWLPFHDALAAEHTVYAPELPGTSPSDPYAIHKVDTFWELLLIYEELIRALDVEGAVVVGESFGGMMAADLSAHFPAIFSKLVLLAPAGLWLDEEPPGWFEMASGSVEAVPGFLFHDPQCQAALELFAMPEDTELIPTIIAALTWAQGCSGKFLWPIPDHGLARRLHRITAPTLIIFGRQDRVMQAVYGEEYAKRVAGSRLEIIEECGHIPHVEKGPQALALIRDFLQF